MYHVGNKFEGLIILYSRMKKSSVKHIYDDGKVILISNIVPLGTAQYNVLYSAQYNVNLIIPPSKTRFETI